MLGYAPRILDHLTLVERLYVDHIMSQPFKVPANSTDALELLAKRSRARKKNQGDLDYLPKVKEEQAMLTSKRGDRLDAMTYSFEDDSILFTFPSSASMPSDLSLLID